MQNAVNIIAVNVKSLCRNKNRIFNSQQIVTQSLDIVIAVIVAAYITACGGYINKPFALAKRNYISVFAVPEGQSVYADRLKIALQNRRKG